MRKLLSLVLVAAMLLSMVAVSVVPTGASSDPADSYKVKTAPNEDSSIKLWFQHSNVKVQQNDTTSTGRNTYSIHMAKNERQGAQIVLYNTSSALKADMKVSLTDFVAMDGSGATVESQLFFEYYLDITNVDTTNVLGVTKEEDSIIRNGITPDPIAPAETINFAGATNVKTGRFGIAAGVTQSFIARAETTEETPSGWYQATFNLYDVNGNVIKTADLFAYVWDFVIPEEPTYQTSMVIGMTGASEETYKIWYDYLLENRISGKCIPGEITSDNPYVTDPRVSAFSIADKGTYLGEYSGDKIAEIYTDLSAMDEWEKIKEKAYFYLVDEPTSKEQADVIGRTETVDKVINKFKFVSGVWEEDPYYVVPFHENHPYPYYTYDQQLAHNGSQYLTADDGSGRFAGVKDAIQGMMDADAVTIWCPKMNAYTPRSVIASTGYVANNEHDCKVRDLDGIVSGFNIFDHAGRYFDWDSIFGSFEERINSYLAQKEEEGKSFKLWWYACGNNSNYTYANHLIENSGLQTQLMPWQSMQVGATGYLYYASNTYSENGAANYTLGSGKNYNGTMEANWMLNKGTKNGYNFYGNGVLFWYSERTMVRAGSQKYVGSLRVELMRDGIEDYEMLNLYRQYYGEEAMQDVISQVSDNVVCYLSLPGFKRDSKWASSMTDEDVFEQVRRNLGAAVEAATPDEPTTFTVTIDGEVFGTFEAGETVELPVPEMQLDSFDAFRFFTYTGAEVTRSEYEEYDTANGRMYTLVMPEGDVELTSDYVLIGDANLDDEVSSKDNVALKKLIKGITEPSSEKQAEAADVRLDGEYTSRDSSAMKKIIAGVSTPSK